METYGVKYIGSKAALVDTILKFTEQQLGPTAAAQGPRRLIDVFTGTTRVAQAFRSKGWRVETSDLSWASEAYANAFLLRTPESSAQIPNLLATLRRLAAEPLKEPSYWITKNYCDVTTPDGGIVKMWKPENGRQADRIRHCIAQWEADGIVTHHEAMILVACLLFALDKVDSSVGVQQAYLKSWAARASNPLDLVDLPYPASGPVGKHTVGDALTISYEPADVAYLDPPYSAHSYATYYHIWDSITRWDQPAVGLKTNRRIDRVSGSDSFDASMTSPWNSKGKALGAFLRLVERLPARAVLISYNDESLVPLATLVAALKAKYGDAAVIQKLIPYRRNIMSQIGNAEDKEDKKLKNNEVLLWVQKEAAPASEHTTAS
jgi:adenine-specific DNA-methyltransferase